MAIGRTNAVVGERLKVGDITLENKTGDSKFLKCDESVISLNDSTEKYIGLYGMCVKKSFTNQVIYRDTKMQNIVEFNGMFFLTHTEGGLYYSLDKINWKLSMNTDSYLSIRIVEKVMFIFSVYTVRWCYSSTDGINWTKLNFELSNSTTQEITSISYGGGLWIIIPSVQNYGYYTSSDAKHFVLRSQISSLSKFNLKGPSYKDGLWICAASRLFSSTAYSFHYYTSVDGIVWVDRSNLFSGAVVGNGDGITWSYKGRFLMQVNTSIYYSDDGLVWTKVSIQSGGGRLTFYDSKIINEFMFAFSNEEVYYSKEGINWFKKERLSKSFDIAYAKGLYVFGDSKNNYEVSRDGVNWVQITPPTTSELFLIKNVGNEFVQYRNGFGILEFDMQEYTPKFLCDAYIKVSE